MTGTLKITAAIACGLLVGGGAVQVLHAQVKPPAYVVAEIAVRDPEGYEKNFLEPTRKEISDHGGKFMPAAAAVLLTSVAALVTVAAARVMAQRLPWGLPLRRRMDRSYLLGLRRLLRILLAVGSVSWSVDQRLLLKV